MEKTFNMRGDKFHYRKELAKRKKNIMTNKKYIFHFTKVQDFIVLADDLQEAKKKLRKQVRL